MLENSESLQPDALEKIEGLMNLTVPSNANIIINDIGFDSDQVTEILQQSGRAVYVLDRRQLNLNLVQSLVQDDPGAIYGISGCGEIVANDLRAYLEASFLGSPIICDDVLKSGRTIIEEVNTRNLPLDRSIIAIWAMPKITDKYLTSIKRKYQKRYGYLREIVRRAAKIRSAVIYDSADPSISPMGVPLNSLSTMEYAASMLRQGYSIPQDPGYQRGCDVIQSMYRKYFGPSILDLFELTVMNIGV